MRVAVGVVDVAGRIHRRLQSHRNLAVPAAVLHHPKEEKGILICAALAAAEVVAVAAEVAAVAVEAEVAAVDIGHCQQQEQQQTAWGRTKRKWGRSEPSRIKETSEQEGQGGPKSKKSTLAIC